MKTNYFLIAFLSISILLSSCSKDDDSENPETETPCTTTVWYADSDGDGFGNPDESMKVCNDEDAPEGYVTNGYDANDTNAEILDVTIWTGDDLTFSKASSADWTLAENQDKITDNVTLTRQDKKPVYNYQWWINNYGVDASGDDLQDDFWFSNNITFTDSNGDTHTIEGTGGTKGIKWAILDDTGFDTNTSSALEFEYYGTLGIPDNFFSLQAIATATYKIEDGDLNIVLSDSLQSAYPSSLVGKKLGVWIVDEDIYFTLTFTEWGSGGSGGALGYTRSTKN